MTIGASFALQAAVLINASRHTPLPDAATVAALPRAADTSSRATDASFGRVALLLPKPERPEEPEASSPAIVNPEAVPLPPAIDPAEVRRDLLRQKIHFKTFTPEACLPVSLMGVIYDLAEIYGEVQILSTHRDPKRNARVGGAGRSVHLECRAIDFKVPGRPKDLLERLRQRPEVGGFKRYPSGYYHIDNGPKRTW